jgi:hypothetical protein
MCCGPRSRNRRLPDSPGDWVAVAVVMAAVCALTYLFAFARWRFSNLSLPRSIAGSNAIRKMAGNVPRFSWAATECRCRLLSAGLTDSVARGRLLGPDSLSPDSSSLCAAASSARWRIKKPRPFDRGSGRLSRHEKGRRCPQPDGVLPNARHSPSNPLLAYRRKAVLPARELS